MAAKKYRKVYDDKSKGTINLEKSIECCFPHPLEEREQIFFCLIDPSLPYDLEILRPDVAECLKKYCEQHHREFLFVIWPEGYPFALVYNYHDENNAENDKAVVLFLVKVYAVEGSDKSLTLDDVQVAGEADLSEFFTDEEKVSVIREEEGNLRETILVLTTLMTERKYLRDRENI